MNLSVFDFNSQPVEDARFFRAVRELMSLGAGAAESVGALGWVWGIHFPSLPAPVESAA